ncbi:MULTISPECIES: CaiB/BaiF CoA transferase family protein [Virgibacillus]|uniref:CoA-transferase n=1 Tax=Virgibacillus pantothenticus TaxID=1473 RepID=A0A0L0QKD3_VIRPA|nr:MULTISPECIES: CoA transferase [Virgibacillus]API91320.1 CoA transferase [Virgibacillus sp. 6R]KNE19085.1 CoA-transferase [Virgibacillus pantothenticus]MBS7426553.1 CoA transferase [Virgibacillus sp. 19R1-5]MED3738275.1 CoA transferase [Virgibacillus pantothenticus]QTY15536.1 CoA transferase [Virgibacillus pantothenticus]
MAKALEHIRILDLSRVLAGPYCTMILGDLGAEIIKVEAPGGSDETRKWGPPFQNGVSAYYLCTNRNKKSITIDLKSGEGVKTIKQLVKDSDVIINNFRTGTMERFGLDYETLSKINPKLIYCSITGFGETGPYKDMPGYDFIIQAMSGLMSITGDEQTGPQKMGVAITDVLTGMYACIGIQAALLERSISQQGQKLDIALYDVAVSALVNVGSNYFMSGEIPSQLGNQHANIVPYQTFRTKDGQMVIAAGNDRQFEALCDIAGEPSLKDNPKFRTNPDRVAHRKELIPRLQQLFSQQPTAYWLKKCKQQSIPCGPIQNIAEVAADPQLAAREMFVQMSHPTAGEINMIGSPLKLSRTPVSYRHHPPNAGEHNQIIMD